MSHALAGLAADVGTQPGQPPQQLSSFPNQTATQPEQATQPEPSINEMDLVLPDSAFIGPLRNPNMDPSEKTYTCTYQSCSERFDTHRELQMHKREKHRPPNIRYHGTTTSSSSSTTIDTQSGPHNCMRINPGSGQRCSMTFSRPYDLTRHEDTIHNANKHKYRCPLCQDDKTFSRKDALTRHFHHVHPESEYVLKRNTRKSRHGPSDKTD
jgi:hypothetical protein